MTTSPFDPASVAAGAQPAPDTTTPMPAMPAMPGRMPGAPSPYEIAGPQPSALLRKRGTRQIIIGAALFVIGLLITVVTYGRASSSPSGGSYFVAYGPMIIGVVWAVRGAGLVARSRRMGR